MPGSGRPSCPEPDPQGTLSMWPALEQMLARYQELEQQLSDSAIVSDRARYATAAKEHGGLARRIKPYLEYKDVVASIGQAEELLASESDPEMKRYAEEELNSLRGKRDLLQRR